MSYNSRIEPLVLITDDTPEMLVVHRLILQRAGISDILSTTDAREALHLAYKFQPDLIISDINKPDMTGLELLTRLRADPRTRMLKFLFVTADSSKRTRAFNAGADGYLDKPIRPEELIVVVWELLPARFRLW